MADAQSPQRFPDLYSLLSLQPLESDSEVIAGALRRLAAQVKSTQLAGGDAASATRGAKIYELGKHHLLSPERKTRYDQQWRLVHDQSRQKSVLAHPVISGELARLLPSGDPDEPFRLEEYLQWAAKQPLPNFAADFQKLQGWLGSADEGPSPAGEPGPHHIPAHLASGATTATPLTTQAKRDTPIATAVSSSPTPAFSPARQLRKRRERFIMWSAIAVLGSLGVALGSSFWWREPVGNGSRPGASSTAALPTDAHNHVTPQVPPAEDQGPRRSGLPSVAGISPGQDLTANIDALVPVAAEASGPEAEAASMVPGESPPSEPPATDGSSPMVAVDNVRSAGPPVAVSAEPTLDAGERAAWTTAMTEAKRLIGEQLYADARNKLAANELLAKTEVQQAQLRRLSLISRLAEELHQAIQQAIAGLEAGELISYGNSQSVPIVDAATDRLTIRASGGNVTFELMELPLGLAFALSDFSLAAEAPSTKLRKAAFALVHPPAVGSDRAAQLARELMAAAIAAGVVDQDLLNVCTDDYQLPGLTGGDASPDRQAGPTGIPPN